MKCLYMDKQIVVFYATLPEIFYAAQLMFIKIIFTNGDC